MNDRECVAFLQWALPRLDMRWPGFRKVRRQVCKRVSRRMLELRIPDYRTYQQVLESNEEEWAELDRLLRIPISRFYRDRDVWSFLENDVLPKLAGEAEKATKKELRIWSIGCASGEEPYSLNILWRLAVGPRYPRCKVRIIATDVDERMLARARNGCYRHGSLKELPAGWREAAFTAAELFCIREEFRDGVELRSGDVRSETPQESIHLVLCRNLAFTYFDEKLQKETLHRILGRIVPGGALVIGKKERLPEIPEGLMPWSEHLGVYGRR